MQNFSKNTDVLLSFALVFMLGLILIPLPPFFLDTFLALNITLSILILIISLYIKSPLDLSVFPGLLLILTLFRLALNISSTRLILIDGYAGKVIDSFGSFVVGGNYVVGFLVFIILIIIQFIVIVKGSGRISEVSARFVLDAMPGKQMAIDADLNTGILSEDEAKQRREDISREAEFFGAMDGASKFVKGDAIAGLLINAVNILGGFIIGVAQKGLTFQDALKNYTILTIGDGLVSQIPALIIATAAGFVVTRSAAGTALDFQIKEQLLSNPRVLATVAAVVLMFAFLPGMPTFPFLFLSVAIGAGSYFTSRKNKIDDETVETVPNEEEEEEKVEQYLQVDPIEIEIGFGLISLVDEKQGGELFHKISATRKFMALEYGVLIPPVRVRDNLQLDSNEYIIKIKGNIVANYSIHPERFLAMNPGNIEEPLEGIQTRDPAFKLPGYWITQEDKDKAELLGYTVVDGISVLSTHLQETLKMNFDKILSRQAVKQLIENLKKDYPAVIEDINPELLSLGTIQKVLQNLLREGIPIKDLVQILEALIDYSKVTKNVDVLSEYARHSIGDTIASLYADEKNILRVISLGEHLESIITGTLQNNKETTNSLGLGPEAIKKIKTELEVFIKQFDTIGYKVVIITNAAIRPYFYRLISPSYPEVAVVSYSELPSQTEIEFVNQLEIIDEN